MKKIELINIVEEDFLNYKYPSMFLISHKCDFKCCTEQNLDKSICQNFDLMKNKTHLFSFESIYNHFINNNITKSIVIGGMEPFLQFEEIYELIRFFRFKGCYCDFVIYTGYNIEEIEPYMARLKPLKNIIIKFGRFIPNQTPHYDKVLGINLISDNQYAERIC